MTPKQKKNLILDHMYIAHLQARKKCASTPMYIHDDIKACAYLGLVEAADKFDESRGLKFNTYATHRVRGAILDGLRAEDWLTKVERKKVNLGEKDFNMLSLDFKQYSPGPESNKRCDTLSDTIAITNSRNDIYNSLERMEAMAYVESVICKLKIKVRYALRAYYYHDKTMRVIGTELSLTESRVSQIITRATKHIKKRLDLVERIVDQRSVDQRSVDQRKLERAY